MLRFQKMCTKRAFDVKTEGNEWVGFIDYSKRDRKWRFLPESDKAYTAEPVREILNFMDNLKDTEGDEVLR